MTESIIVAIITGCFSVAGAVIAVIATSNKNKQDITEEYRKAIEEMKTEFKVAQEVMKTEVKELTREVREHNNFAKRMPVVETEIKHIEDNIHKLQSYHEPRGTKQ